MSVTDHSVQRLSVEGLRSSDVATLSVLVAEPLRLHIERLEPACVADLFALAELALPGSMGEDLGRWAARATREIKDFPDGATRENFVIEIGGIEPALVPERLRAAMLALKPISSAGIAERIGALGDAWAVTPPAPVVLAAPPVKAKATTGAGTTRTTSAATAAQRRTRAEAKPRAARTPAAQVDPRRAEWIREDALSRLGAREYAERGLKESILLAGIKHRSPFDDLKVEEIKAELRKLERERKVKHTGERWMAR